jgi:hypothetical protein
LDEGHGTGGRSCTTDPHSVRVQDIDAFSPFALAILPSVSSIVRLDSDPTTADSVRFRVTFDRDVSGVDTSDFSLASTASATGTITSVLGSGSVYTVTVDAVTGNGTLRLDVDDDDSISDGFYPLGGNGVGNGDYTGGEVYTIENIIPRIYLPLTLRNWP